MKWHLIWHLIWHSKGHLLFFFFIFWVFNLIFGFWSFCHTYFRNLYQMPCQISYEMTPDMASDMTFNRTSSLTSVFFYFGVFNLISGFWSFCHTYYRNHIFKCQVFTCWRTSWCLFAQTYLLIWVMLLCAHSIIFSVVNATLWGITLQITLCNRQNGVWDI